MSARCSKHWITDSEVSNHMERDESLFHDYQQSHTIWQYALLIVLHLRSSGLKQFDSPEITLRSVLNVPKLDCNLTSISKFTRDHHCITKFLPNVCFSGIGFGEKDWQCWDVITTLSLQAPQLEPQLQEALVGSIDLPKSHNSSSLSVFSSTANKDSEVILWHYCLGHVNFIYLKRLCPHLFMNKDAKPFTSEICHLGKHTSICIPSYLMVYHNHFLWFTVIFWDLLE